MKNKRGMSPVIATVLLVILTIVAVAIVTQIFLPFTKDSLSKSKSCFTYREYFVFDDSFKYNCYNSDGVYLTVKARGDKASANNIGGFDLVLLENGVSKKISVRTGDQNQCGAGGIKSMDDLNCTSKIRLPAGGEVVSYKYNYVPTRGINSARIYPYVIDEESKEGKICEDPSNTVKIGVCSGS